MRRSVVYLIVLICLAGVVQAQSFIVGPGDTVKIPLLLMDTLGNPTAVDSAADSVLIRVVKNFAANASGADTCYLHRGLMDASTNALLHTTGNATTTLGFGQTPKRLQTFSFFATAYALTNSATASGTYTIEVFTYDHSLNLVTTRTYSLNYIYGSASTYTFAMWGDSITIMGRNVIATRDTANGIMDTLQVTDTRWDSTLAVFADANTLVKNRLLRIRDTVDNILDTLQLHDNWVAKEASVTIVRDTLALYDTRFDSLLSVVADANTLLKNRLLRIRDTIDAVLDTLQTYDGVMATVAGQTLIKDTVNGILDSLQLYDGRWALASELTKVTDTANAILDTLQLYDGRYALASELTKVIDTVNGVIDTLQSHDNWVASAANLTKVIDTVNGVIDTLQNASSTLRLATVDTAAVARSVWDNDVVALLSRTATATATVDTAAIARSVWDDDIVARANRTIDGVDTVVLACINGDTVSNAGDFLKTALDYREAIKNIYGVATSNSTWMTDTVLNQLIRQAVVKVNPLMRGVKFKDTVITAWQQSDYALDSMIGVISVSWQREDTVRPIVYAPLETWGALTHQSTWGGDDPYLSRPSVYDVTDNQIMFFPPPTQTDTVEIVGFRKVYGIVTTSDFSAIPQSYRIPVLYYAAFLVAQSKQHPGTDRMLNEYNKAVSDVLMALNRRANAPTDSK